MTDAEPVEDGLELSPQEVKIFRETFNALDTQKRGVVGTEQIGHALRILSQCPTEAELQQIINDYMQVEADDEENNDDDDDRKKKNEFPKVDFETFCTIMKEHWKQRDDLIRDIMEAFAKFDAQETGLIDSAELKNVLMTMGETLEEAEVNELLKDAKAGTDGKVAYDNFARHMVESYPRPASKKKGSGKKSGTSRSGTQKSGKKK